MGSGFILVVFTSLVALSAITATAPSNDDSYKVVCLYESIAAYRSGNGTYDIGNIKPELCTHIIYGYAGINSYNNRIQSADPNLDLPIGKNGYQRFVNLASNSPVVPLLGVGGSTDSAAAFSSMASRSENRQIFIQSAVEFLQQYGFKGLDINWQYPGSVLTEDKNNFASLLVEAKSAFQDAGFILTATVSGRNDVIDNAYDVVKVSSNVDFLNVIAYDFQSDWGNWTGANAPLYPDPNDGEIQDNYYNVNYSIHYWNDHGAPYTKLVLGMAAHGHSFTQSPLLKASNTGILPYYEICQMVTDPSWTVTWNPDADVPYAFNKNKGISYDDVTSLNHKCDFILSLELGGGEVAAIDEDDFNNFCKNGTYPLLTLVHRRLIGELPTTVTPAGTTLLTEPSTPTPEVTSTASQTTTVTPQITTTPIITTTTPQTTTTTSQTTTVTPQTTTTPQATTTPQITTTTPQITTTTPQITTTTPEITSTSTATTTTPATTTSTTTTSTTMHTKSTERIPTTPDNLTTIGPFKCTKPGYTADPYDCSIFYDCIPNGDGWIMKTYHCSEGLVFNPETDSCDFKENVPDCHADV